MTTPADERTGVSRAFLGATFLSQLGSAAALLAATVVSSNAGTSESQAALFTALMLAFNYGMAALVTPYSGRIARKLGTGRTYALTQAGGVAAYAMLAIAMWAGLPGYPTLMILTPFLGAFGGLGHVVSPLVSRAYFGGGMALSQARTTMATGLAWVIGAIVGAWVIDHIGAPSAFLSNALLTVPLVAMLIAVTPREPFDRVATIAHPWRDMFGQLRSNDRLRRAAVMGLATVLFVAPLVSMVVPLTRSLNHDLAVHAGVVLACIAFGEMFAPMVVRMIGGRWGPMRSASTAYLAAGLVLLFIAGWTIVTDRTSEFLGICVFAVVFGAVHYGGTALLIADVSGAAADEQRQEAMSAYFFVLGIGIPLGTILWGQLLGLIPPTILLALTGGAMLLLVGGMITHLNRLGIHLPPAVPHDDRVSHPIGALRHHWF